MLPTRFIEKYLQHKPEQLKEIVLELRNIIASVAPGASEKVIWKGLVYYDEKRGGAVKGGICHISVQEDHVCLAFIHGAFLPDPQRLLVGQGKAKRFVRIRSYDDAPWDWLTDLIVASYHFDPASLKVGQ